MSDYVVTAHLTFRPTGVPREIDSAHIDVFHGSHDECVRVCAAWGGVATWEGRRVDTCRAGMGTLASWRLYLAEL